MKQLEAELDRYLTLLRDKIQQRGYHQIEIQRELGWGQSYVSQLLTKQKGLRVEQVLLMLKVIGIHPAEFFGELYDWPEPPAAGSRSAPAPLDPGRAPEPERQLTELAAQVQGLVGLLVERRLISGEELRVAVEAAEAEP
jgi:transcriptional regulator with XRE-family HTH domain